MNKGVDDENAVDEGADGDGVGESGDREVGKEGGTPRDSWSAAAPTESDEEIPLPWTVVDDEELDEETPEAFEELRFVGPKTAEALRDSVVDVEDIVRKRVSYRDLTERGVHPGVAAKIRREHSLSWSFDSAASDLSRRSSQVRGLDDDERAWVAASSGWTEEESAAETDGSGDATSAESAWQARRVEFEDGGESGSNDSPSPDSPTDGESAWRAGAEATADDGPTRDEEAAWRAESTVPGTDDSAVDGPTAGEPTTDGPATDDEAAWRERASDSDGDDADGSFSTDAFATDAEAAWREQSAPTPVTALDDVDDGFADQLADAGIRSVRRLATADPESVADALELDPARVERWCEAARAALD